VPSRRSAGRDDCLHVAVRNGPVPEKRLSGPGGCRTWESPPANRPQRSVSHRLLGPSLGYGPANPARIRLVEADFRFRRPKPDSLME
jgi:hypothetical protein